ncbi:MAG: TGS domain-containing protein [Frisingicoccus sp.]
MAAPDLEWQKDMSDNREFMSLLKNDLDLFSESVYCFTPAGDVKNLPNGSTPIDFAYSIHSAVGNKMVGARVNGKLVTIDYQIQNGDRIEVITSQNSKGPSRDWLSIVKSTQAKNKINQWFKTQYKEENILRGKEQLDKYCKSKSIVLSEILKPEYMDKVIRKYGFRDWDAVLAAVGHGGLKKARLLINWLKRITKRRKKKSQIRRYLKIFQRSARRLQRISGRKKGKSGIIVKGLDDVAVRFSKCCNPVPGMKSSALLPVGRGVSIHRTDCVNMIHISEEDRARILEAEWLAAPDEVTGKSYKADINIYVEDRWCSC